MSKKLILFLFFPVLFFHKILHSVNSEWTILVYIQADNNLCEYADKDMMEMLVGYQKASLNNAFNVNVLTQVDYPQDKKTWRFKIDRSGKIEHDSLNQDMGEHPAEELIASAAWIKDKYPANHYALVLWNHGSGIEDYRKINTEKHNYFNNAWMDIFDTNISSTCKTEGLGDFGKSGRGILYDDSEKTCLTNSGLNYALSQIKNIFGKKIDLVGMDACLMAMVEVAYEIKDYAEFLVASQETEEGNGWEYSAIIAPLVSNPNIFTAENLAKLIVSTYGFSYASTNMQNYTQSAINLNLINQLTANIDAISVAILECMRCQSSIVKKTLRTARLNSKSYETKTYIDLHSFYTSLHAEITKIRHELENNPPTCFGFFNRPIPGYRAALDSLTDRLNEGIGLIDRVVLANVFGARANGSHGISIYYPFTTSTIHSSYPNTAFAKNTHWINVLRSL